MSTMTSPAHSRYRGLLLPIEPSDEFVRPANLKNDQSRNRQWSLCKRALQTLAHFLITFCVFLAAILVWWSYGNVARQMTADLYRQLGWSAPHAQTAHKVPDSAAIAASAALYPDQQQLDADRIVAGQEQMTRSADQAATSTNQAASAQADGVAAESRAKRVSSQPMMSLNIKSTEAGSPQILSEKGKQLSAAGGRDSSCFPSASAVLQNHRGGWPSWTLKAPGHEGTICWYASARPRARDHRREMTPGKEIVGTTENGLPAPPARADWWGGGLP
jgi:hypothetical protein